MEAEQPVQLKTEIRKYRDGRISILMKEETADSTCGRKSTWWRPALVNGLLQLKLVKKHEKPCVKGKLTDDGMLEIEINKLDFPEVYNEMATWPIGNGTEGLN
ncbi:MAG: hypothetical protein ABSD58_08060 [Verrucomicrobiia bacterium]|jgi:hypothetical protein